MMSGSVFSMSSLVQLLRTNSTERIINWLEADGDLVNGKECELKPHFVSRFSDILRRECKQYLEGSDGAPDPASRQPISVKRVTSTHRPSDHARTGTGWSTHGAGSRRASSTPEDFRRSSLESGKPVGFSTPISVTQSHRKARRKPIRPAAASPGAEGANVPSNEFQTPGFKGAGRIGSSPGEFASPSPGVTFQHSARKFPSAGRRPSSSTPIHSSAMDVQLLDLVQDASRSSKRRLKRLEGRLAPPDSEPAGVSVGFPVVGATDADGFSVPAADAVTPVKQIRRGDPAQTAAVEPNPERVTDSQLLDNMSSLYSQLIERNHILGLAGELVFLTRLLAAAHPGISVGGSDSEPRPLSSLHNVIYFSSHSLWLQRHLLTILDSETLRLLATNRRVRAFTPELVEFLRSACQLQSGRLVPPTSPTDAPEPPGFAADTVSRPNFPSEQAFNAFRRQRDLLCELTTRCGGDWRSSLAADAPQLFAPCRAPVNLYHLSRLLVSLLLQHCGPSTAPGSCVQESSRTDAAASVLQQTDRRRIEQLNNRFSTPAQPRAAASGSCSDVEELFRCLLLEHSCPEFLSVLRDVLADTLLSMDAGVSDDDAQRTDAGTSDDQRWRVVYWLRLLAKFLALAAFSGHYSSDPMPETVSTSWIAMKNQLPPPIDLLFCLERAVSRRQLLVSLPWMMQYLSCMDSVSVLTAHHQTAFCFLVRMRPALCPASTDASDIFLRLHYEQLFQAHWRVQSLADSRADGEWVRRVMAQFQQSRSDGAGTAGGCEQLQLPAELFYHCCPRLTHMRTVLLQFNAGGMHPPSPAVRKIVPIETSSPAPALDKTQSELEQAFYHSHNPSLRRTLQFLVERFSSSLIKQCRGRLLPAAVSRLLAPVHHQLTTRAAQQPDDSEAQLKEWLEQRLCELALERHAAVVNSVTSSCDDQLAALLSSALDALLHAEELTPAARRMCHRLATVAVHNKLTGWLGASITRDFLVRMMRDESKPCLRAIRRGRESVATAATADSAGPRISDSHTPMESPGRIMIKLKELICAMESGGRALDDGQLCEQLDSVLPQLSAVHQQWSSCLPTALSCLLGLTAQLAVDLMRYEPSVLSEPRQTLLADFWNSAGDDDATVTRLLLSAPSIWMLSGGDVCSWRPFADLLKKVALRSSDGVAACAESCVALMRHEWPEKLLLRLAGCIESVAGDIRPSVHEESMSENKEWLLGLIDLMRQADFADEFL